MTDKQVIVDGVDIKNCKRRIGKDNFCRYYKRPCSENNYNCIWKKYLRKEQECEALINQRDKFEFGNNILEHERNNYKQALDKIEEFCIVYSSNHDAYENVYKHILEIINEAKDGEQ